LRSSSVLDALSSISRAERTLVREHLHRHAPAGRGASGPAAPSCCSPRPSVNGRSCSENFSRRGSSSRSSRSSTIYMPLLIFHARHGQRRTDCRRLSRPFSCSVVAALSAGTLGSAIAPNQIHRGSRISWPLGAHDRLVGGWVARPSHRSHKSPATWPLYQKTLSTLHERPSVNSANVHLLRLRRVLGFLQGAVQVLETRKVAMRSRPTLPRNAPTVVLVPRPPSFVRQRQKSSRSSGWRKRFFARPAGHTPCSSPLIARALRVAGATADVRRVERLKLACYAHLLSFIAALVWLRPHSRLRPFYGNARCCLERSPLAVRRA